MKKEKWLWGLCACVMACVAFPMAASAADEIGYYEATASGRTYNGTNVVAITDFVFAGVLWETKYPRMEMEFLPPPMQERIPR